MPTDDLDDFKLPPPGSPEYRRVILNIAASEDIEEYHRLMRPVFTQRGWRVAVEVMIELLGGLAVNCPKSLLDAFGTVKLGELVAVMDEETKLNYVSVHAAELHPEKPRHEAIRLTVEYADRITSMSEKLLPVWERVATVLRRETGDDVEEARVILTRWLNTQGDRVTDSVMAASLTRAYLRKLVMPPGKLWVQDLVDLRPRSSGVPLAARWAQMRPNAHTANETYGMAATILGREPVGPRRCSGCGRIHSLH
ncbi:hypothetical protein ACFPC0_10760 [Streptomyces andamanensis]|uniref:Uncharacterized protein n=1 Tax=Streptomyces andamanensis TaxID=1565035 RepID=A0ABV8TCE1_9ACTN